MTQTIEYIEGQQLIGQTASEFWTNFLTINQDLITTGNLETYPLNLAQRHFVSPSEIAYRRCDTPILEIIKQLSEISNNPNKSRNHTEALSLTFGLNFNGNHTYAGLLGFDLEKPPSEQFQKQISSVFADNNEPTIIINTGGSYHAICFGNIYEYLPDYARRYGQIARDLITRVEPGIKWPYAICDALTKGRSSIKNVKQIADYTEATVGHWGNPRSCCVDFRHFAKASLNSMTRGAQQPLTPDGGLITFPYQPHFRIGPKRETNELPTIIGASEQIPLKIESSIDVFYEEI